MALASGLYDGEISDARGARWRRRRAVMLFVDLDEVAVLARRFRLFSARRLALAAKSEIEAELRAAGLATGGPVQALCAPGFTAYLCHGPDGELSAVRYVAGARAWLVPASLEAGVARLYADTAERAFGLRLRAQGETAQIALDAEHTGGGFAFATMFLGRRRPIGDLALLRARTTRTGALAQGLAEVLDAWTAAPAAVPERRLAA